MALIYSKFLQTKGVFACHCFIDDSVIRSGILIVSPDLRGSVVFLLDPLTGDRYKVKMPYNRNTCSYNMEVKRHA